MCLFTHFAAGALVGGATGNIWAGAVAGAASHAVLDAIPHYDHPDWRLELMGGVFSLILLLLMPFATIPAVIGGIFGMVPDLENLFQKLGKMRRDQFIFPSHTGLIPHGRTLGPRTLVWQVAIFIFCFALLGVLAPGSASAADQPFDSPVMGEPVFRVVASTPSYTRLEIQCPVLESPVDWSGVRLQDVQWGMPQFPAQDEDGNLTAEAPRLDFSLAVPTRQRLAVQVSNLSWWKEPSQPVSDDDLVRLGTPGVYRDVPLTGGDISLGVRQGVLRSLTLEIQHLPSGESLRQLQMAGQDDPADKNSERLDQAPSGILNPSLFQELSRGGRRLLKADKSQVDRGQFNHFDLTNHWLRLEVDDNGLHSLTGQELSSMGVSTGSVDPAKLRLYRGGRFHLAINPEVPEADQEQEVGLTELAIQVLDGNDGEWNLDDEIRFYGFGTDFWNDRADTEAGHLEFYNHPYENKGVYWLTWEDATTNSPIPGSPLRVTEMAAGSNGGDVIDRAKMRRHFEEQTFEASGVVSDDWVWDSSIYYTKTVNFDLHQPMADSLATFVVEYRGYPTGFSGSLYNFMVRSWVNDDTDNGVYQELTGGGQANVDSLRVRAVGSVLDLNDGPNLLSLENANTERDYPLVLDSFDLFYWSALDLASVSDQLEFAHWREQVTSDGQTIDVRMTVPANGEILLWDVSDTKNPVVLTGDRNGGLLTTGLTVDRVHDRHLLVTRESHLYSVSSGSLEPVADLRSEPLDAHYIVVYADAFAQAAETLADFRGTNLPGISSPVARAVSLTDIYNNFSGGQKDLRAIRNYLKSVYDGGEGNLQFVCLLGNGTRDHRNYKDQDPSVDLVDLMPGQHRTLFPRNPGTNLREAPYGSDDVMVSFDAPVEWDDVDYPDVSIGRLPAMNVSESLAMVDRMIEYTEAPEAGSWSNKILMVADDCTKPGPRWPEPSAGEKWHTDQAEYLSRFFLPASLDNQKIFGVVYDFPPGSGVKPQVRADINATLNEGVTIFHYVGHGAEDNLADEQIFQSRDIPNLTNGMRRSAFIAFSCDVGVYDSPARRSMAEQFVVPTTGGAIASICASQVSYIGDNNQLSNAFYSNLYPDEHISGTRTLGEALLLAKAAMGTENNRRNSQRYNLLSDPAIRLPNPVDNLEFAATSVDTLRAGARQVVVLDDSGGLMLGAGDSYTLRVEESAWDHGYIYTMVDSVVAPGQTVRVPRWQTYEDRGSPVFDGRGTMTGNELRVPFKVPVQLKYGDRARLRLILDGPDGSFGAHQQVSSVRNALGANDDVVGPTIGLAFEDNRYRVKAGTMLNASLTDTSSIAILGTTPGNSILLEFDSSGFMTDVTESFQFDADSYQGGRLSLSLPGDLPLGQHQAALHASDVLGNVGNDTISFIIVPESVVGMDSITLFPNPTPGPCRLIFELSDPMRVQWDIYTLSGRRIKSTEENLSGGQQILHWDGRDEQGDEIANGTYIYVLRGNLASGGERDITETGKLVIMR